jgi:hypothetical protein
MGVRGLVSRVPSSAGVSQEWKEHAGPPVVVDGSALIYHVFRTSCPWAAVHWPDFERNLVGCLGTLQAACASIVVLLDGATTHLKMSTMMERAQLKIDVARSMLQTGKEGGSSTVLLPPCTTEIVMYILSRLGIEAHVCIDDADVEIARTSSAREAVIIGEDGDFLLLPNAGYAPLRQIFFDTASLSITASVYFKEAVATSLDVPALRLPLLGALCVNDYTIDSLLAFYSAISPKKLASPINYRAVVDLVCSHVRRMPASEPIATTIANVLTLMRLAPGSRRFAEVQALLSQVIELYQTTSTPLARQGPSIPRALSQQLQSAPRLLDVLIHNCYLCVPLVETARPASVWAQLGPLIELLCAIVLLRARRENRREGGGGSGGSGGERATSVPSDQERRVPCPSAGLAAIASSATLLERPMLASDDVGDDDGEEPAGPPSPVSGLTEDGPTADSTTEETKSPEQSHTFPDTAEAMRAMQLDLLWAEKSGFVRHRFTLGDTHWHHAEAVLIHPARILSLLHGRELLAASAAHPGDQQTDCLFHAILRCYVRLFRPASPHVLAGLASLVCPHCTSTVPAAKALSTEHANALSSWLALVCVAHQMHTVLGSPYTLPPLTHLCDNACLLSLFVHGPPPCCSPLCSAARARAIAAASTTPPSPASSKETDEKASGAASYAESAKSGLPSSTAAPSATAASSRPAAQARGSAASSSKTKKKKKR